MDNEKNLQSSESGAVQKNESDIYSITQKDRLRTEAVWVKMTEIFGSSWASQFGDEPNKTWIQAISEIEEYQLARGFEALKASGRDFPPSLALFVQMCRQPQERQGRQRESVSQPYDPANDLFFVPVARLELLKMVTFHVNQHQLKFNEAQDLGRKIRDIAMPEVKRVAKDYQLMIEVDKIPAAQLHDDFMKILKDHIWPLVV